MTGRLALDVDGLLRALDAVEGLVLLGVVDGGDAVELVFGREDDRNLVSIYHDGPQAGTVCLGWVAGPEGYARRRSRRRPWGERP